MANKRESDEACRNRLLGDAIGATEWVRARRCPFYWRTFADAMGMQMRTAQRWLDCLEGYRLIEKTRELPPADEYRPDRSWSFWKPVV